MFAGGTCAHLKMPFLSLFLATGDTQPLMVLALAMPVSLPSSTVLKLMLVVLPKPPVVTSMFMLTRELSTARLGDVTVSVAVNCVASLLMLMLVAVEGAATSGADSMPSGELLRGAKLPLLLALLKLALELSGVVQRRLWLGDMGVPQHTSMLQELNGVLALYGDAGTAGGRGGTADVLAGEGLLKVQLAAVSSFFWHSSSALTSDLYCSEKQQWFSSCRKKGRERKQCSKRNKATCKQRAVLSLFPTWFLLSCKLVSCKLVPCEPTPPAS